MFAVATNALVYRDIGHQQRINQAFRVIFVCDNQSASAGKESHKIGMFDRHFTAVRQMQSERLEWRRIAKVFDFFNCHVGKLNGRAGNCKRVRGNKIPFAINASRTGSVCGRRAGRIFYARARADRA